MIRSILPLVLLMALAAFSQTDTTATAVAAAPETAPALSVASVTGTLEIKAGGTEIFVPAEAGTVLKPGDTVMVKGAGSSAQLIFSDGSTLDLAENAGVGVIATDNERALFQNNGGIFYKIIPGQGPFRVATASAAAAIHGTDFAVRIKADGAASFAVVKGKIGVKGAQGEEVFVKAGELCRAAADAAASAAEPIPADILKKLEEWGQTSFEPYVEPAPAAAATPESSPAATEAAPSGEAAVSPAAAGPAAPETAAEEKKEEEAPEGKKEGIQWSLGMGSATVDGKNWSRLSLRPDIPLGPFGICLDLEIFIDDQGDISDKGWRFKNATQTFESLQRKIYYIRYGRPGDKIYARLGALDNVTLGYGLIMYGYSNALQYPDVRKMGLQMELNELPFLGFGVQGMVNNFQDFQKGGALVGVRPFFKPLSPLGLPLLGNLVVGATLVKDYNQRAGLSDRDGDKVPDLLDKAPDDKDWAIDKPDFSALNSDTNANLPGAIDTVTAAFKRVNGKQVDKYRQYVEGKDPFAIGGVDVGLPIISTKALSLIVYAQVAAVLDDGADDIDPEKTSGWGLAAPGVGVGVGPLKVNVEYRHFKDQFQGEYFDQSYELDRMKQIDDSTLVAKEAFLADDLTMDGVFGRATLNLINLVELGANYQWMTISYDDRESGEGRPSKDQSFGARAGVGETIRNVLRKAKVDDVMAYYQKKYIGSWPVDVDDDGEIVYDRFLQKTPFVLMGYKVGFRIAASLVLYWDTQYTYVLNEETGSDPLDLKIEKRRNVEAVIRF